MVAPSPESALINPFDSGVPMNERIHGTGGQRVVVVVAVDVKPSENMPSASTYNKQAVRESSDDNDIETGTMESTFDVSSSKGSVTE